MTQAIANRTRKTHIGLALIALGTVMIFANVTVVANFFSASTRKPSARPPPQPSPSSTSRATPSSIPRRSSPSPAGY